MLPHSLIVFGASVSISELSKNPSYDASGLRDLDTTFQEIFGERVNTSAMCFDYGFWECLAKEVGTRRIESIEDIDAVIQGEWDHLSAIIANPEEVDLERGSKFCHALFQLVLAEENNAFGRKCFLVA